MPDKSDYIWIQEAAERYHRSRGWLDEQIRHGKLTYAKFEGDRHTYLRISELDKLLGKPVEEGRRPQDQVG